MQVQSSKDQKVKKLEKLKTFLQSPELATLNELEEINTSLKVIAERDSHLIAEVQVNVPDVQKFKLDGIEELLHLINPLIPAPIHGKDGYTPKKGVDYFDGEDGEDGKDADEEEIISKVLHLIPLPKDAEFDKEELFKEFITLIRKDKLIDVTHVKGIQGWIKDGVKYRFEELMHGGANSKASSNELVATGVVNGINTQFTFTQLPTYIVSDGVYYKQKDNNGNTVWSWNSATLIATMVIPPSAMIWGIK